MYSLLYHLSHLVGTARFREHVILSDLGLPGVGAVHQAFHYIRMRLQSSIREYVLNVAARNAILGSKRMSDQQRTVTLRRLPFGAQQRDSIFTSVPQEVLDAEHEIVRSSHPVVLDSTSSVIAGPIGRASAQFRPHEHVTNSVLLQQVFESVSAEVSSVRTAIIGRRANVGY